MNEFEFLAVFISIVVGLGVTHILSGLARIIHNRRHQPIAKLHFLWTINVLLILLLNWWVLFLWADFAAWSFDVYLLLIGWAISLYMLAVILYPSDIQPSEASEDPFVRNRQWFFGTFLVFIVLDVAQTAVRGQLFEPRAYLPFVLHFGVLAAVGMVVEDKRYQVFMGWYFLIVLTLWSLLIRRFLGG